jgi:hypothetical protein
MNWRRGLFRLWIVGSVLFVIAVAVVRYREIKEQFENTGLQHLPGEILVPQRCSEARGVVGTDYMRVQEPWIWWEVEDCWYDLSKFRPLYSEFKNVSDEELIRKLYTAHAGASPIFRNHG